MDIRSALVVLPVSSSPNTSWVWRLVWHRLEFIEPTTCSTIDTAMEPAQHGLPFSSDSEASGVGTAGQGSMILFELVPLAPGPRTHRVIPASLSPTEGGLRPRF